MLIADDLLATGGTMAAVVDMVRAWGRIVECCFMAELDFLNGRTNCRQERSFHCLNFWIMF